LTQGSLMAKAALSPHWDRAFFLCRPYRVERRSKTAQFVAAKGKEVIPVKNEKKDVIAYRKACNAEGTGLSHYILMGTKPK
jgi:modified peptide precursor CbpA